MPASITALVNTLNEEHNIGYCLRSVRPWCDQVIVVDMQSDDHTVEIARSYADIVLSHERVGFVEPARQMGFAAATGDWIFVIDADELVPAGLADWLRNFADGDPPHDVVLIPRANVFLGRWLRSTPWWPGKPRFFRPGAMGTSTQIHHGFQPRPGARIARVPRDPALSLWHFAYPNLTGLADKTNRYTSIEAEQALAADGRDPGLLEFLTGPLRALAPYILRRGYRDGIAGLAYAINAAYYQFLATAKRWDVPRAGSRQAEYDRMREEILAAYPQPPPAAPVQRRRRAVQDDRGGGGGDRSEATSAD